ncbi:MAG: hypothetical protein KatS3mg009_1924 [Acidimicrobiia bacterium]|nr:MAG: hypothetical protein KatS3mg009_1924 [Acidimicrobiia bacterium]
MPAVAAAPRRPRAARAGVVIAGLAVAALAWGCGGDGGAPDAATDTSGPGPNPSPASDPGPNDTSDGPTTVQGVLRLDAASSCITLETDLGRLALSFTGYELAQADGRPVLRATDDGRVLADESDEVVVTGRAGEDAPGPCGAPFAVESLNTVVPAP